MEQWNAGTAAVLHPLLFVRQKAGNQVFLKEICHTKNLAI